jgi:hypothetical protein
VLLLSTKEKLPARLSDLQQRILAYCRRPRSSVEIAGHHGLSMSGTYKHLRLLQRLDQLERVEPEVSHGYNRGITFVATNRPINLDQDYMEVVAKPMVMGVRL